MRPHAAARLPVSYFFSSAGNRTPPLECNLCVLQSRPVQNERRLVFRNLLSLGTSRSRARAAPRERCQSDTPDGLC